MREKLKGIPDALKKQLFLRFGAGIIFIALFILILVCTKDFYFALPCIVSWAIFTINGFIMLYDCLANRYIILSSECVAIERTAILRRIKSIDLSSEQGIIRIPIRGKIRRVHEGCKVVVYTSSRTAVYEIGNERMLCGYYAIEIQ